jgi:hypothetical protein
MSHYDHDIEPELPPRSRGGRSGGDAPRRRGRGQWFVFGLVIAGIIGVAMVLSFSQTGWGRAQILGYTLQTLGGRLNGQLTIERLEGNLITGARIYQLALRDHDGVPLALVDSAYIQYRVATLLGGDVVITRLVLYDVRIDIFRMPGDTVWNYQEILRDPDPDPEAPPGATLIERMRLHNTHVRIRGPIEPDPRLSPARWERELSEMLADDRWMIEEVPGGHLREMLFDIHGAAISELFIGPDERGGIYLELTEGSADVRLWRDPPLEVRGARAQLHLHDGIVNYSAPEIVLPNTRGESVGRIDLRGDRPMYDVVVTTPAFALADLRWLYPWLPEDPAAGRGSLRLWIEDRPDDLLVLAQDVVLEMPDTHITGQFGVLTGPDVFRFVDVDLEASPLNVESVERLLPADLPVEGLRIGSAVIRGES